MLDKSNSDSRTKALSHWSKVRDAVFGQNQDLVERIKSFPLNPLGWRAQYKYKEPLILQHGIKLVHKITIKCFDDARITQIIFNRQEKTYLVIFDDGNINLFTEDGSNQEVYQCKEKIISVAYAEKYNSYVTVCRDNYLRIFTRDLELLNSIPFTGFIDSVVYNEFTHEILTYGRSYMSIWLFRTAGTILIPARKIYENISTADRVSCVCIEETSSESQRCFTAVERNLFIYLVADGTCLHEMKKIHNVNITRILFFKPLEFLVTSGKDGSIKVWNNSWRLDCIFVGHTHEVTSLSVFPYGPYIMSASLDGAIRTWSLDTKDEMHCLKEENAVIGLQSRLGVDKLHSFTTEHVNIWEVHNLHSPFTILGSRARSLKTTTNPLHSPVSYCVCDDACVRLMCPVTGELVTVFMTPNHESIEDAVYHIAEELLFVLLDDGSIIKASTKTNPCKHLAVYKRKSYSIYARCATIALYEYIAKAFDADDVWGSMIGQLTEAKDQQPTADDMSHQTTLLIGGCADGTLVIYEWEDKRNEGEIVFSLQAHRESVTTIAVNPKLNQLASASKDKTLKVWRVFPFAEEALTPLLLFINSNVVYLLSFSNHVLSAVFQDNERATYTLAVYKTKDNKNAKQLSHNIKQEHCDHILSLSTCRDLRLIATSSMDGTVRIWNSENELVRVLQLNNIAHAVSFSSPRGNLLLAIGNNIHFVHHSKYLPRNYLYQMIAMEFKTPAIIKPVPINEDVNLEPEDRARLFQAHSSFLKFMQFVDKIPIDEQQRRDQKNMIKDKEFGILAARDKELELIRDGKLRAKRKPRFNKSQKEEAFKNYLSLFYQKPGIEYPKDDNYFDVDDDDKFFVKVKKQMPTPVVSQDDGFFAINYGKDNIQKIKDELKRKREEGLRKRDLILNKDEVSVEPKHKQNRSLSLTDEKEYEKNKEIPKHPLSASTTYVERLQAMKNVPLHDRHKDLSFAKEKLESFDASAEQEYPEKETVILNVKRKVVKRMEHCNNDEDVKIPIAPDGHLPNSVVVALYRELRREVTEEEKMEKWKPKMLTAEQLKELNEMKKKSEQSEASKAHETETLQLPQIEPPQSRILEEFREVQETISPIDIEDNLSTPPITPPPEPEIIEKQIQIPKPEIKIYKPRKPIKKLKPSTPPIDRKIVRKESLPPPRPPTPLPDYVRQFVECDWFQTFFPSATRKDFGQSVDDFVKKLVEVLKECDDYDIKIKIVCALLLLLNQHGFLEETCDFVQSELLVLLNLPGGAPSSKSSANELNFIKKTLQLLLELKTISQMTIVELMTQYTLGTPAFRLEIMNTFEQLGLQDSKGYFTNELCTKFDLSNVEPSERKRYLNEKCYNWLCKWTTLIKKHITSLTGKICRAAKGHVVKGTVSQENVKSILKKNEKMSESSSGKTKKSIAFVSDEFVEKAATHVGPIEAINYFCEVKFEEELQLLQEEAAKKKDHSAKKRDKNRNTVLMVPKMEGYLSLARLGETHQSKCHPERETGFMKTAHLPPVDGHQIHSLLLHVNRLTLNPFPDELDELLYTPTKNSDLITLRSSQKYFIPSRSVVTL